MKIKLNSGAEYWVSWIHNNTLNKNDQKMDQRKKSDIGSYTECYIQNKTNSNFGTIGNAILGKKEKFFNKDIGRKISLAHAMSIIGLNKETRTLFWNEYHKLTNKPQRIK